MPVILHRFSCRLEVLTIYPQYDRFVDFKPAFDQPDVKSVLISDLSYGLMVRMTGNLPDKIIRNDFVLG